MTDKVDFRPQAADYERCRGGCGAVLYDFVGARRKAAPEGPFTDPAGDRLEESIAVYRPALEKLIPADRSCEERHATFLFSGQDPEGRTLIRNPPPAAP